MKLGRLPKRAGRAALLLLLLAPAACRSGQSLPLGQTPMLEGVETTTVAEPGPLPTTPGESVKIYVRDQPEPLRLRLSQLYVEDGELVGIPWEPAPYPLRWDLAQIDRVVAQRPSDVRTALLVGGIVLGTLAAIAGVGFLIALGNCCAG